MSKEEDHSPPMEGMNCALLPVMAYRDSSFEYGDCVHSGELEVQQIYIQLINEDTRDGH